MRVAYSYTRFSSKQQADGTSQKRQARAAQEWCERNDYRLADDTFEDLGVSAFEGRHRTHGALGTFVDAAQEGMFPKGAVLLIENADRLSRQGIRASTRLLEEILETGVEVVFLSTGLRITLDSLDRLDTAVIIMVEAHRAAEESRRKSDLVRRAWHHKREALEQHGALLTRRLPSWIRISGGRFVVDKTRVAVVRRVFGRRVAGHGPTRIAYDLNRDKIPTFRQQGTKRWHKSTIMRLLASKSVLGTLVYGPGRDPAQKQELESYYPQVIDQETFDQAQAMATETPRGSQAPAKSPFAYGLARCGACGAVMTVANKGPQDRAGPRLMCISFKTGAPCGGETSFRGRPGRGPARSVALGEAVAALAITMREVLSWAPSVEQDLTKKLEKAKLLRGSLYHALDTITHPKTVERTARALDRAHVRVEDLQKAAAEAGGPLLQSRLARLRTAIETRADTKELAAALRGVFRTMTFDWSTEMWTAEWRHAGTQVTFAATMKALRLEWRP